MIDYCIQRMKSPMSDIKVDLGTDFPLWMYVKKAIQDIEVINELELYRIDDTSVTPFIHVINWKWNPHPSAEDIQHKRRETGDKVLTKSIGDARLGILEFDVLCGARDKNKALEMDCVHNKMYIPIEDDQGRYLLDNILYSDYQLVDKLLYPSGHNSITLKSLLPIKIKYEETTEASIDGYMMHGDLGFVQIFTTMESIISCFMHIPSPLSYLGVYPLIQFCDKVLDDKDKYHYFKPLEDAEIYVKAHKEGCDKFKYVRSILVMACDIIRKHHPDTIDELHSSRWWIYKLSYYENIVEHRGACDQMHVARMLDTISAQILPIPDIDKRIMISLLKYCLQTDFDVNIFSYENKRLRHNEILSTIVTAEVSDKLKRMFKYGMLIKLKDMTQLVKFNPDLVLKKMHSLGTIHTADFSNDLDYCQSLRYTLKGPNALGRNDKNKIKDAHRQLHPSMIGKVDLLESSKDVGQSGMISPWGDLTEMAETDKNKYPNVSYELFMFIQKHFPNDACIFHAKSLEELNRILDRLVYMSTIDLTYYPIPARGK